MKESSHSPYIQKLLTELGDLVFPPSADEKFLRTIKPDSLKRLYQTGTFQNTSYLSHYSEPFIQAAILENKFHHNHRAAKILGDILRQWSSRQTLSTLYVPIPLGKKRLRQRGHNQVETIINTFVPRTNVNTKVLCRSTETLPQSQLDKTAREKNVKKAFQFIGDSRTFSSFSQVVLVDDVLTTGNTMKAARASLAPHLPPDIQLICLAIAH